MYKILERSGAVIGASTAACILIALVFNTFYFLAIDLVLFQIATISDHINSAISVFPYLIAIFIILFSPLLSIVKRNKTIRKRRKIIVIFLFVNLFLSLSLPMVIVVKNSELDRTILEHSDVFVISSMFLIIIALYAFQVPMFFKFGSKYKISNIRRGARNFEGVCYLNATVTIIFVASIIGFQAGAIDLIDFYGKPGADSLLLRNQTYLEEIHIIRIFEKGVLITDPFETGSVSFIYKEQIVRLNRAI